MNKMKGVQLLHFQVELNYYFGTLSYQLLIPFNLFFDGFSSGEHQGYHRKTLAKLRHKFSFANFKMLKLCDQKVRIRLFSVTIFKFGKKKRTSSCANPLYI